MRNQSTCLPREKNPKGEAHEDLGFVSWDRSRRRLVFRQLHVEGFVTQYVADSVSASPDSIVFRSEAIETIPSGYRVRETWRVVGPDEFVERFEMARRNGDFAVDSESRLRRTKATVR